MEFIPGIQFGSIFETSINKINHNNKLKYKTPHMIISPDRKSIGQNLTSIHDKTFSKLGRELSNLMKVIWQKKKKKTNSYHYTWGWNNEFSPSDQEGGKVIHSFPFLFNIILEVLSTAIRQEKQIKRLQIGKEEIEFFLICREHEYLHRKSYRIY